MDPMLLAIFILTLVGTLAGVVQAVLQWWMLRELGDLDKTRTDWWEKMEDGDAYKGVMRWLRFNMGRSNK